MTFDRPAEGLVVAQPARGFRYAVDAFWLAGFALDSGPWPGAALDLGTGSGIVAMLLGGRGVPTLGLDVRPEWAPLWAHTLAHSRPAAPVCLERADVLDGVPGGWDLVVANPPYFVPGEGPVSPDPWKRAARTETTVTLAGFVRAAVGAVRPGGRVCLVVDRRREGDVVEAAAACGAAVQRWVRVGRRRVLVALGTGGGVDGPEAWSDAEAMVWVELARTRTPAR